jgi:DNA-binding FrmR family transcriptional regulator
MKLETRDECLKRLSYIEGHVEGVRRMVQQDQYCVDILKQTYAVRKAIEKLELLMLGSHMDICVVPGIKDGREEQIVGELMELYKLADN